MKRKTDDFSTMTNPSEGEQPSSSRPASIRTDAPTALRSFGSVTSPSKSASAATSQPTNLLHKPVVAPTTSGVKVDFGTAQLSTSGFTPAANTSKSVSAGSPFFRPSKPIEIKPLSNSGALSQNLSKDHGDSSAWSWVDEPKDSHDVHAMDKLATKRPHSPFRSNDETHLKPPPKKSLTIAEERSNESIRTPLTFDSKPAAFGAQLVRDSSFALVAEKCKESDGAFDKLLSVQKGPDSEKEEGLERSSSSTEEAKLLDPISVITGEEHERSVFKSPSAVVKFFDARANKWAQKGVGPIHVNIRQEEGAVKGRIVVRHRGSMALVLNTSIFPEMSIKLVQERTLIMGVIEHQSIVTYALQFENADVAISALDILNQIKTGAIHDVDDLSDQRSSPAGSPSGPSDISESDPDSEGAEYDVYHPS